METRRICADGGCLCGTVRYVARAQPLRVTYCHCRFCQRSTGSAYLVEPVFAAKSVEVVTGRPRTYLHRSAESGQMVTIHFCAGCGTKVFLSFEDDEGSVGVFGGTFDDPDWYERSPAMSKHIYLAAAQQGTVIPAGVPVYLQRAHDTDGRELAPLVLDEPRLI